MKRIFTFLALAAALVAVSCAKEQDDPAEGKAMVSYTIDGPMQVATKAMGTIGSEYTLYYEVRLWDGSALGEALSGDGLSGNKDIAANAWPATVTFDLARGKQYKILFWAQSKTAPAGLYNASNLTAIAINYSKMAASNEECDAFYGSDVITPTGATAASATLYRPFALVNLGTSDAAQFKTASGGCTVGDVKVTVTGALANSFNVATGEPGAGVATNFAPNAAPIDAYDAKTLVVGESSFNYLSAVYVLPAGPSDVIEVAYDIKDNATTPADITSLTVSNVPVHANYRTNITGKLLTGNTTYEISVDQAFAGNTNKDATPVFPSIAALNTFFASQIATGPNDPDNGDIYPETVTVTAIPDGDATTITLPNDTLSVAINIQVPYAVAEGLTIAYPTAEGAKHSNKVFFNMSGLSKLTANLPDTHLEVVSGSNIDLSDVHTSASTFVVQKNARVGVLNIKQGNAEIAGAVANVYVVADATSNGETPDGTNPVQVFLTSESAVEKIHLSSQSDVTVEQPKDQIEVEATEKKVAVYVNNGAANSTATAQNGGVIYVEANVPCTVTADGTSTAEEGTTVIVNEGSSSSTATVEVVATNGGTINVTAKDDCAVSAAGTSEAENPSEAVPSTVTINEVKSGTEVDAVQSQGGEVVVSTGVDADAVDIKDGIALIGKEVYLSLAEAVAAVPDETPTTITMIGDDAVENGITIAAGKNIVLELAGHTVSGNTNSANTYALITNRGTLTIQDNTDTNKDGTGTGLLTTYITNADQQDVPGYASNTITNNGTLTVKSGKLVNNGNGYACYAIDNQTNGTLYNPVARIEGGCMEQMNAYTYAVRMFCNSATNTNAVEITGGIIRGGYGLWLQMPSANSAPNASLSISGGSIISRDGAAAYIASSYNSSTSRENVTVNISGGTFTGSTYGLMVQGVADGMAGFNEFDISGGIISGIAVGKNLGTFISGGYFGNDPTNYLTEGLEANMDGNGWWTIGPAVWSGAVASDEQFAASVDETAKTVTVTSTAVLAKLAANVQAGNDYAGYKITLTKDMDLDNQEWTPIGGKGKNFAGEFDGGGHTISNLKITRGKADVDLNWRVGFIGSAIGAKVHDLTIHNANVTARGEVAAAVGYNAYSVEGKPSEIYNVNVTGHVVVSAAHRGAAAICGYSNYYVHDCKVNVDDSSIIDGFWASGGIVGFSPQSGDIKNNYSNIKVVSDYACGGIVGLIEDSVEISGNTVESTSLQASANYGIGGLIGMMNYGTGLKIKNNTVSNVTIDATENVAGVIGAVWADYGTGAVEITNNIITGITINSSKGDGTAAFIGYIESARTATISGNSIQGTINTAKALVNDGIWAGVTDASNVVASDNTMNITVTIVE